MAMKYCPNCGSQIENNTKFCPNCGTQFAEVTTMVPPNHHYNNAGTQFSAGGASYGKPPIDGSVKKRGIVSSLIFSLITCGLYVIYWIIKVTNEMNTLLDRKNATGGLMTIIFTILTCGLYGFYWAYKLGDNVDLLKGNRSGNTGILFLVVYIFCFGIINVALAQDAINDKLDGIY
jgi:hypothetical protein